MFITLFSLTLSFNRALPGNTWGLRLTSGYQQRCPQSDGPEFICDDTRIKAFFAAIFSPVKQQFFKPFLC